jgi:hypothetical protein
MRNYIDPDVTRRIKANPDLYRKTVLLQDEMQKNGVAWHNQFADECCSDFACCTGRGNYLSYIPSFKVATHD